MRTLLVLPLLFAFPLFAQPRIDVQGGGVDLLPQPPPPASDQDEVGEPPPPPDDRVIGRYAPENALPPPQPITRAVIDQALMPYGRWISSPDYGRVWAPANVAQDWKPYTEGRWVDTDHGWSFSSTAPWAVTFHYGRWGYDPSTIGWYWVPGMQWGPAWVTWKVRGDDVAWAPLPPRGARPGWQAWSAIDLRHLGRPIQEHLLPERALARIIREGRPMADINSIAPPGYRRSAPPRGYGRRPAPYP